MLIVLTHGEITPLLFHITWHQKLAKSQLCYWKKSHIGPILSFDAGTVTKIRRWEEAGGWCIHRLQNIYNPVYVLSFLMYIGSIGLIDLMQIACITIPHLCPTHWEQCYTRSGFNSSAGIRISAVMGRPEYYNIFSLTLSFSVKKKKTQ